MAKRLPPMHPGEVLREEFLVPLKVSAGALARACGVPRTRIERIATEETSITADTAVRLGLALNTTSEFWMSLQADFDLQIAKAEIADEMRKISTISQIAGAD